MSVRVRPWPLTYASVAQQELEREPSKFRVTGSNPVGCTSSKRNNMKKQKSYSQETQEEKEARWAKQRRNAISFAKQAGIKVVKKAKKDTFDY